MADKRPHKRDEAALPAGRHMRKEPLADEAPTTPAATLPAFLRDLDEPELGDAPSQGAPKPRRRLFPKGKGKAAEAQAEQPEQQEHEGRRGRRRHRGALIAFGILVTLAVTLAIGYAILSNTSAFSIQSLLCEATEHVSSEDIATLAAVPEGTTLLNYDAKLIEQNLRRNPWVGEVQVSRVFPNQLRIEVTERTVAAIVPLNPGNVVWCLGDDSVWIEPIKVTADEGQTNLEAALVEAQSRGALLISDIPSSVSPVAGSPAEGDVFSAISTYRASLSPELWGQIASISAPSVEGLTCTLTSGVEISLGTPTAIPTKEGIIEQLLAKYPNRLTYINVRVPSNPSYRMVDSETVQEGTGVLGGGYGPNIDERMREEMGAGSEATSTQEAAAPDSAPEAGSGGASETASGAARESLAEEGQTL